MVRRSGSSPPPTPARPTLTLPQLKLGITRVNRRIAELEAFDPQTIQQRWAPEVKALEAGIEEALSYVFGLQTAEYKRYAAAAELDHGPVIMQVDSSWSGGGRRGDDPRQVQGYLAEGKKQALMLLRQAVKGLEEEVADLGGLAADAPEDDRPVAPLRRKVFVVHGHDEGAREAVARFLEGIGFEAIILHEQANQGRTVIEKVEAHGDVGFAVVLLTPDDLGKARVAAEMEPRARQNVLLELGYFIGRLTRARVFALRRGDVVIPSDFAGVVYQAYDDAGAWRAALARELQAAGYEIDWNRVMR